LRQSLFFIQVEKEVEKLSKNEGRDGFLKKEGIKKWC